MSNKLALIKILLFVVAVTFYGCKSKDTKPITINIIHMNDIHSHIEKGLIDLDFNGTMFRFEAGGYPLIGSTIKHLKSKQEHSLLLNAGDALEGTLYFTLFHGEVDVKMMNLLKWDAFALGNHEFGEGDSRLASFIESLRIPVLASNIYAPKGDKLYELWKPYIIREFDGEKVAIIGVDTVKSTRDSSSPGANIKFYEAFSTVKQQVEKLETQGINKIIVLSHLGYEKDKKLAVSIDGIDVIVGGHSHTVLGELDSFGLKTEGDYPTVKRSVSDEKVCIVQAGSFAKMVGNLEVSFDENGRVSSCKGTPIIALGENVTYKDKNGSFKELNSSMQMFVQSQIKNSPLLFSTKPDPVLQSHLEYYKKQVNVKKLEVIGYAQGKINHIRIPRYSYGLTNADENPLGSDVVPVVSKAFYQRVKESDLVILNAGAVRSSIKKGDISTSTIYNLLPFSNTLVTFEMSAFEIKQVLEEALDYIGLDSSGSGSFPYAYGMRYDVNMSAVKGNRISNIDILDKMTGDYFAIEEGHKYSVTTIRYLAMGKDGYNTFKTLKGIDSYFEYANSFAAYVKDLNNNDRKLTKLSSKEHCIKSFKPY